MTKRIVCVHQGYELYGSDRTFLNCVDFLRGQFPYASVDVLLPKDGALAHAFRARGINVTISDLWVLRRRYGVLGLLGRGLLLPLFVWKAIRNCASADLVYINTSVIIDYLLAARFYPKRCIIHVHEIPGGRLAEIFRQLVSFSGAKVLFNSAATRDSFRLPAAHPQAVVLNGVDLPSAPAPALPETNDRPLHLLLIGRINAWKGQELLVDALARLPRDVQAQVRARIVGDVFEGAPFRERLLARVAQSGTGDSVKVEDFRSDPSELYAWADLVVVPSLKPEPFGLVAVEAMAQGRPVLAARHGGLTEIVVEGETGWFHQPGDSEDLARKIHRAVVERGLLPPLGEAGRRRFNAHFTTAAFRRAFVDAVLPSPDTNGDVPRQVKESV